MLAAVFAAGLFLTPPAVKPAFAGNASVQAYEEKIADIAERDLGRKIVQGHYVRIRYFKDVSISYDGAQYRLLASYMGARSLPAILNWFVQRGYSEDELLKVCRMFMPNGGTRQDKLF